MIAVEVGLLGPLLVVTDDGPVLGLAAKERALLAFLGLRPGRVVSVAELVAGLWGDDPPRSAHKALQTYVSRLRRVLPAGVIRTVGDGYALAVGPGDVDAGRFESLVARARRLADDGNVDDAVGLFVDALSLWRGRALIDLLDQPTGMAEAARLEELRRGAEEDLVEARLTLGEHLTVVAEAEALVAAEPLRERRWAQLMMALYRCGRQADALRAYRRLRERLAQELGIAPSAELVALEEAVLLQKAELAWRRPDDATGQRRQANLANGVVSETDPDAGRPELPSGVVSFVLTDIEGSTAMWDTHPREMAEVLERHDEMIAKAVSAQRGVVLKAKGEGDSTMSVFVRASDAVAAALDIQRTIGDGVWPQGMQVRVRMAVNTGEAHEHDGDYFGPTLNRAARLRALAAGGEVLCTAVTAAVVRDKLADDVRLIDRGEHQLRGLSRSEQIFEIRRHVEGLQPDRGTPPPLGTTSPVNSGSAAETADRPPVVPYAISRAGSGPWVGRRLEQQRVSAMVKEVAAGASATVIIEGEPGVGKTRLAAEVARAAAADGAQVLFGRCDEGLAAPYQPFAEGLRTLLADPGTAHLIVGSPASQQLSRLIPELPGSVDAASITSSSPESERWLLFQAIVESLRQASSRRPLVLVIDDLQWAEPASHLLFRHLARASICGLLLLATCREGPDSESAGLMDLRADLARDQVVETVALAGLSKADLVALVEARTGETPGDDFIEAVYAETGGNAFFVDELIRHWTDLGALPPVANHWPKNDDMLRLGTPRGIAQVLARRIAALPPPARQALALGAVVGHEFDLAVVSAADEAAGVALFDLVDSGACRGLVAELPSSLTRYCFAHDLVREVVLAPLSPTRRARLHWQVATALASSTAKARSPIEVSQLAQHFKRGMRVSDAMVSLEFSEGAEDMARAPVALADAGASSSPATPTPTDISERTRRAPRRPARRAEPSRIEVSQPPATAHSKGLADHFEEPTGRELGDLGTGESTVPEHESALDVSPFAEVSAFADHFDEGMGEGTGVDGASVALDWLERAGDLAAGQYAYEEALDHYRSALVAFDRCPPDQNRRYRLLVGLGTVANALSDLQTARPAWLEAAAIARAMGDAAKLSAAVWAYGLLMPVGPPDHECDRLIDETLELAGPGDSRERASMLAFRALKQTDPSPPAQRSMTTRAAKVVLGRKRAGRATRREADGAEAVAMARRLGDPETLVQALDSATYLLAGTSRAHERRQMLVEQLELLGPTGRVEPMIYVHLASVELQLGRRDQAESAVQRAVALGHERHMMFVLNNALRLVAALALMEGRFSAARRLAAQARDAGKQASEAVPLGYPGEILGARIEQGPDLGLLDVIKNVSGDVPALAARRAMVAGLYADLGHFDEARAELRSVAASGFAEVSRDTTFPLAIRYLAESCCQLREVKFARRLLKEVESYAGQVLLEGLGTSVQAAADRSLGQLYWTLGRVDDADRSFSAARELELQIGAPPLVARTCYWHAKMVASTRSTEVVPRAAMLLDETLRTTGALGMTLLNRQAHELKDSLRH